MTRNLPAWLLCCLVVFLSALLSFSLQPMVGRVLLPFVGGAPMGWLVILAFFQAMFLCGYGLTHFLGKLHRYLPVAACLIMVCVGTLTTFTFPVDELTAPAPLLAYLAGTFGLISVGLAMIAPAVQALVASSTLAQASNPYPLYAISNIGSFMGLLGYPFLAEPLLELHMQTGLWRAATAFLAIIILLAALALRIRIDAQTTDTAPQTVQIDSAQPDSAHPDAAPATAPGWKDCMRWVVYAAIPSALIGAMTLTMTNEIASFPLMWVIPLALYLATFIIAFSRYAPGLSGNQRFLCLHSVLVLSVLAVWSLNLQEKLNFVSSFFMFAVWLCAFFCGCLMMHLRLSAARPAATHLTLFYLMVALGGVIGGSIMAFVTPLLLNNTSEFYVLLAATLAFSPAISLAAKMPPVSGAGTRIFLIEMLATMVIGSAFIFWFSGFEAMPLTVVILIPVTIGFVFFTISALSSPSMQMSVFAMSAILLVVGIASADNNLYQGRNFFGVIKVYDAEKSRVIVHGTTLHGLQPKDPAFDGVPVSYYSHMGPVGDLLENIKKPAAVAVVGLGAGQMACHAAPGRVIDFYEIDPEIVDVAKTYFHYLQKCPPRNVITGDGRLELAKTDRKYALITLDAFSSDAIPVHLLTLEATKIYRQHLEEGGAIAFHISNRYLDLRGPLSAIAGELGMKALTRIYVPFKAEDPYATISVWVAMTNNDKLVANLEKNDWQILEPEGSIWSDGHSNIFSVMKLLNSHP